MADQNSTLTQEYLLSIFEYKDGELYWKNPKNKKFVGLLAGCIDSKGYRIIRLNGKNLSAHRIIFMMHNGYLPNKLDHKDCNPSNNNIENLRPATNNENGYNTKLNKSNKSGIKGICFDKTSNKWQVGFRINGRYTYFGKYHDIDYAKFVVDAMRYKYHKNFANKGV